MALEVPERKDFDDGGVGGDGMGETGVAEVCEEGESVGGGVVEMVWRTSKVEKEEEGVKGVLEWASAVEANGCQRVVKVGLCL